MDSVGLITARVPGKSTVTGAVEAIDPQSGHTIAFSKVSIYLMINLKSSLFVAVAGTLLLTHHYIFIAIRPMMLPHSHHVSVHENPV